MPRCSQVGKRSTKNLAIVEQEMQQERPHKHVMKRSEDHEEPGNDYHRE